MNGLTIGLKSHGAFAVSETLSHCSYVPSGFASNQQ